MFGRQCTTSEGIRVISEPPGTFRKISLEITQRRDEAEATRGTVICYSSVHLCIHPSTHHLLTHPPFNCPAIHPPTRLSLHHLSTTH